MHWTRSVFLIITLLLSGLLLQRETLPPVAASDAGFVAGRCAAGRFADEQALLAALYTSHPRCTEDIARALRSRATAATLHTLFVLSEQGQHSLARRNALRVLGRFAEASPHSAAHRLVRAQYAAEFYSLLLRRLQHETSADPLHDTIWILDTFFFPAFPARPQLQAISLDAQADPLLRERAVAAFERLAYNRSAAGDTDFALRALQSDLPGVRAHAARLVGRIADRTSDAALRRQLLPALETAYADELAARSPGPPPAPPPSHLRPDQFARPAGRLVASATMAGALDRLDAGTRRTELRERFLANHLATSLGADTIRLRSGLPAAEIQPLILRSRMVRQTFFAMLGQSEQIPVDNEPAGVTIFLFADREQYREYMAAFPGFGENLDGVYVEERATLYTYQRNPGDSANSLEATIQHELSHYLVARYLFPGSWNSPGYHRQPKGWFDEGLAEVMAGLQSGQEWRDPAGQYPRRLAELCRRRQLPPLNSLLHERAGYDQFGRFPYAEAWALSIYLINEHPQAFQRIAQAYRNEGYQPERFANLSGAPSLAAFEQNWHQAIRNWCGQRQR